MNADEALAELKRELIEHPSLYSLRESANRITCDTYAHTLPVHEVCTAVRVQVPAIIAAHFRFIVELDSTPWLDVRLSRNIQCFPFRPPRIAAAKSTLRVSFRSVDHVTGDPNGTVHVAFLGMELTDNAASDKALEAVRMALEKW